MRLRGPQIIAAGFLLMSSIASCSSGSNSSGDISVNVTADGNLLVEGIHDLNSPLVLQASASKSSPCTNDPGADSPTSCSDNYTSCPGPYTSTAVGAAIEKASCVGCTVTASDDNSVTIEASQAGDAQLSITMKATDGSDSEWSATTEVVFGDPVKITVDRVPYGEPDEESGTLQSAKNPLLLGQSATWSADLFDANGNAGFVDAITTSVSGASVTCNPSDDSFGGIKSPFVVDTSSIGDSTVHFASGNITRDVPVRVVGPSDITAIELVWIDTSISTSDTSIDDDVIAGFAAIPSAYVVAQADCTERLFGARFHLADGSVGMAPANIIRADDDAAIESGEGDTQANLDETGAGVSSITLTATIGSFNASSAIDISACTN